MNRLLLLLAVLLLALTSAHSQIPGKDGLTVNGIGLGATQAEIVRKLGKPSRIVEEDAGECIGGKMRTLYYPGLKFRVYEADEHYTVGDFEVTSARWNVSGVKVGMTSAMIRKRFGKAGTSRVEGGELLWFYEYDNEGPGSTAISFRKGKVTAISSMYLMC